MSYCGPVWISDYTYDGLYNRMVDVAKTKHARSGGGPTAGGSGNGGAGATTTRVRSYLVKADGSLVEGALVDVVPSPPASTDIKIRYEDAAGRTVSVANAAYRRYDSLRGGILLAPDAPSGATRARVDGLDVRSLELRR